MKFREGLEKIFSGPDRNRTSQSGEQSQIPIDLSEYPAIENAIPFSEFNAQKAADKQTTVAFNVALNGLPNEDKIIKGLEDLAQQYPGARYIDIPGFPGIKAITIDSPADQRPLIIGFRKEPISE